MVVDERLKNIEYSESQPLSLNIIVKHCNK